MGAVDHEGYAIKPFVVLQSVPPPRPTTNPYVVMLGRSLNEAPDVVALNFSWRTALLRRFDVFHAHWPETLIEARRSRLKQWGRRILFLVLLAKLRVTRTPIVRTVHNLELPQGISRTEVVLLRLMDRMTTLRIRLNPSTVIPVGQPFETIPHGDYRGWYARYGRVPSLPGRVLFFGLVRRYKNVDALVRAFRSLGDSDPAPSLLVAGKPSTAELAQFLRGEAGDDERISFHFAFLDDAELVAEVSRAELVVFPAPEMHNSGGVLTALSLERPVLVSRNEVNEKLAEEVGADWVFMYDGELDGRDIEGALARCRRRAADDRPDLSQRQWRDAAPRHLAAYRRAATLRRGRR